MIYVGGLKHLWQNEEGTVDLTQLTEDNIGKIFIKIYPFLKYFNNNYRPIFHLEKLFLYLCKTIHGL